LDFVNRVNEAFLSGRKDDIEIAPLMKLKPELQPENGDKMNNNTKNTTSGADKEADHIFHGGDIVTINDAHPSAEALAVKDGKILAVGGTAEVMACKGPNTKTIDLRGKTMMPGLIDPHSHVTLTAAKLWGANISPPPVGTVASHADLKRILREYMQARQLQPGNWIFGMGYDDTSMTEQRHPDRDVLDDVSVENPIILLHISGHMLAANSMALKLAGVDEATENPEGGVIQRRPGTHEPNGVFEETANMLMFAGIPMPDPEAVADELAETVAHYAKHGVTTAQDGAIKFAVTVDIFKKMGQDGRLPIDVIGYPLYEVSEQLLTGYINDTAYRNHFRLGGLKMVLDGSIQAYTAHSSEP
jgi:predicted amidohydrolase YtcJ